MLKNAETQVSSRHDKNWRSKTLTGHRDVLGKIQNIPSTSKGEAQNCYYSNTQDDGPALAFKKMNESTDS